MDHRTPPESSLEHDNIDLQSLGRDVDKLLKELQEITEHLGDIGCASEHKTDEEHQVSCVEAASHKLTLQKSTSADITWTAYPNYANNRFT